jgi:hypothetical protein
MYACVIIGNENGMFDNLGKIWRCHMGRFSHIKRRA